MIRLMSFAAGLALLFTTTGWCNPSPQVQSQAPAMDAGDPYALPPRLRGYSIHPQELTAELVRALAGWGGNYLHIGIKPDKNAAPPTDDNPLAPYEANLAKIESLLPLCDELGLTVSMALNPYGRKLDVFWQHEEEGAYRRDHVVDFWRALSKRWADESRIQIYDLLGEPNYKSGQGELWYGDLFPKALAALRENKPDVWVMIEPGPWGMPNGFDEMPVIDDPRIVYCWHHFAPHGYTHQGHGKYSGPEFDGKPYPGPLHVFGPDSPVEVWDKARLREYMRPAIEFKRRHDVRMIVSGMGVFRRAPGRERWLSDSLEIFEEEGFDWAYFSAAAWFTPTLEPGDPVPAGAPRGGPILPGKRTKMLDILRRYYARNAAEAAGGGGG